MPPSDSSNTLIAAATVLLNKNEFSKARTVLESLDDDTAWSPQAQMLLGACDLGLGRFLEAERRFGDVVALEPTNLRATMFLGRALENQGKTSQAEQAYERATAIDKAYAPARERLEYMHKISLGRALDRSERPNEESEPRLSNDDQVFESQSTHAAQFSNGSAPDTKDESGRLGRPAEHYYRGESDGRDMENGESANVSSFMLKLEEDPSAEAKRAIEIIRNIQMDSDVIKSAYVFPLLFVLILDVLVAFFIFFWFNIFWRGIFSLSMLPSSNINYEETATIFFLTPIVVIGLLGIGLHALTRTYQLLRGVGARYQFIDGRVKIWWGVLGRRIESIELYRITDISVRQSIINRITGDGALILQGSFEGKFQLIGLAKISDLDRIFNDLRELVVILRSPRFSYIREIASGWNLTEESRRGFPCRRWHASLWHAHRHRH